MAIKFTDEAPKASPRKEQLRAGNKAMSGILKRISGVTVGEVFKAAGDGLQWTPEQIKDFGSEAAEPIITKASRGRKPDPNAKKLLTLRLDPQVIEYFRATGEGWQTRMNDALRKAAGL